MSNCFYKLSISRNFYIVNRNKEISSLLYEFTKNQQEIVSILQKQKPPKGGGVERRYMYKKAISKRKIEKAVAAINEYYDKSTVGYIRKEYLINKGIVTNKEVDVLISRLEGLELITYSSTDNRDEIAINRLPLCVTYFEKKKDVAHQAAFAKVTSIISLIISLIALTITIIEFFINNSAPPA